MLHKTSAKETKPSKTAPRKKKPCKFCQRTRWALTLTILAIMGAVILMSQSANYL